MSRRDPKDIADALCRLVESGWRPIGEAAARITADLCKWKPDPEAEAAARDIISDVTIGELLADREHPAWYVIKDALDHWKAEDRRRELEGNNG